ncbi:ABC transporter ATP-binding protein [Salinibacterium sp. SYSU T00001]|uniref:ABC transporter ATP-binding protein n=1 Tax=Homoserinimonas sedimenticola TaxID=2986805 RepID=UPI0022359D87|nr:ABC transporter ATP-binding protein [Salinibacterium sedimenticola]MCW4384340.1 ABC transporter ATP-binding protein [Salinibacterium sedimenticola]
MSTASTSPSATLSQPSSSAGALGVRLSGVGRTFDSKVVLRDVDLDIAAGEIVALIGASGCGKSTLLRQISGLDQPSTGRITIDGSPVAGIDLRCSVGFQEPRLLPWRSLEHNTELGLPRGTAKGEGRERVRELLRLVGLGHASGLRPRQVSGGMAQRASLARALARRPGVLVLDEPFGALDALTRLQMQDLLLDVHSAEPTTIILVTHDVDEALYLADRVVLLGADPQAPADGATIRSITVVPGARPRDRGDATLAHLRVELLDGLGVSAHHSS